MKVHINDVGHMTKMGAILNMVYVLETGHVASRTKALQSFNK